MLKLTDTGETFTFYDFDVSWNANSRGMLKEARRRLAARGLSNRDISRTLDISVRTVQTHLSNVFNKMGVGSRTEAVMFGLRNGLITLEDTL